MLYLLPERYFREEDFAYERLFVNRFLLPRDDDAREDEAREDFEDALEDTFELDFFALDDVFFVLFLREDFCAAFLEAALLNALRAERVRAARRARAARVLMRELAAGVVGASAEAGAVAENAAGSAAKGNSADVSLLGKGKGISPECSALVASVRDSATATGTSISSNDARPNANNLAMIVEYRIMFTSKV